MICKRILCVLLAVVLLFTWPGFVPEAHAVAGIDDATIAVGLLFATWAGITFASSQGAYTAVSSFLSSSAAGLKACANVVSMYVKDNTLSLVQGVKDAFSSVLPEINASFRTADDSNVGSIAGSLPCGVPLDIPTGAASTSFRVYADNFPVGASIPLTLHKSDGSVYDGKFERTEWRWFEFPGMACGLMQGANFQYCDLYISGGKVVVNFYFIHNNILRQVSYESKDLDFVSGTSILPADYAIPFERSSTINGTQATNAFASATDLPDTVYADDRDRSLDIGAVAGVVAGGLAGSAAAPGLSPSDLVGALKEALGGTIVTPIPTTPPTEATDATEATEPGDVPTIVTPSILEGMFGGLRGWLESILAEILAAIQTIPEKIDAFRDSLTTWWTEAIADAKAWIEVKIQSIADWWTLFWADTIAAVKALGLTVSEFFTVTFPAWITDVKAWALALPQTIIDAILAALAAAFVPAAGYWDAKIAACMAAFPLFNSIVSTGRGLGGFFSGLGARPPVIYIDLGNSASWSIGGRQVFLDLTWYAQYKPTVDTILAGFLWGLFLWRLFLRLPGLLRGEGGTIDRLNTYLESKSTKDGE